jgi:hypothetical protein
MLLLGSLEGAETRAFVRDKVKDIPRIEVHSARKAYRKYARGFSNLNPEIMLLLSMSETAYEQRRKGVYGRLGNKMFGIPAIEINITCSDIRNPESSRNIMVDSADQVRVAAGQLAIAKSLEIREPDEVDLQIVNMALLRFYAGNIHE